MKKNMSALLNKRYSCLPLDIVVSGCSAWNYCGHLVTREELAWVQSQKAEDDTAEWQKNQGSFSVIYHIKLMELPTLVFYL